MAVALFRSRSFPAHCGRTRWCSLAFMLLLACLYSGTRAQELLEKPVYLEEKERPLREVLGLLEEQSGFRFSYQSDLLPADSLVSVRFRGVTLAEALDLLLSARVEYVERPPFVVLRRARPGLALVFEDIREKGNSYMVSGRVRNQRTGEPVAHASVYERQLLLASLSDRQGRFSLRVRRHYHTVALTASKASYADTTVFVQLRAITVRPFAGQASGGSGGGGEADSGKVEKTGLARFLVSSRQRIQSLNLREFFVESPVQASLTPGLSSQGRLSTQMVNKVSVNLIGGYTAGVEGMELGGIFNINKKGVQDLQVAGALNLVGGAARGIQIAGLYNLVLDSVQGMQTGGMANRVRGPVHGLQLAGLYNKVGGELRGVQIAGLVNHLSGGFRGVQLAGLVNLSSGTVRGLQLSGGFNRAGHLHGLQFGLVNFAESSEGQQVGLLNIVRKGGYYRLHLSTSESFAANLSFRSGSSRLYSILQAAATPGPSETYAYGWGLGSEFRGGSLFSLAPEWVFLNVYQGSWKYNNFLNRLTLQLSFAPRPWLRLFAGPSLNLLVTDQEIAIGEYGFLPGKSALSLDGEGRVQSWLGWTAGISLF